MKDRVLYLVAYDVRDPKRLRKIHKALKGFGDPLQFSVFQCELTRMEEQMMVAEVSEIIHHHEDRVIVIDIGRRKGRGGRSIMVLGRQQIPPPAGPQVV